jgi:hypothetical protein
MPFIGYNSITNHYQTREIDRFVLRYPDFAKCQFEAQHKYDGSNFQIIFEKDPEDKNKIKPICFASRNCILEDDQDFNGFKSLILKDPYKTMLEKVSKFFADSSNLKILNLYGEIFGNVIKRVDYYAPGEDRSENKMLFFDVKFNNVTKSAKFFTEWAKEMGIPVVETFLIGSLDECLALDINQFKSAGGDQIEGVVIKPYDREMESIGAFYLKKKMPGFHEIDEKKSNRESANEGVKSNYIQLDELEAYLNANRLVSAFSKKVWTRAEIPALAHEVIVDALKDFADDHEEINIDLGLAKKAYMNKVFKLIKTENPFSKL